MNKTLLVSFLALASAASAYAQTADKLLFSYTVSADAVGKKGYFLVYTEGGNQKIQVDWGNNVKSAELPVQYGSVEANDTIRGTEIKVYGEDPAKVTRLIMNYQSYYAAPESRMLTFAAQPMDAVKEVDFSGNLLKALDLTNIPNATSVNAQNNELTAMTMAAGNKHNVFKLQNSTNNGGTNNVLGVDFGNCTSIKDLYVENQALSGTTADFSKLTNVIQLHAAENKLTSVKLPASSVMTHLFLDNNALSTVDLSGLSALQVLYVHHNNFASFDMSAAKGLTQLSIGSNKLTTLNLAGCNALDNLDVSDNQIAVLDASGAANLTSLYADNNQLTALTLAAEPKLTYLSASNSTEGGKNNVAGLDFGKIATLKTLNIDNNNTNLGTLNLEQCTALTALYANGCNLAEVKLPNAANLAALQLNDNKLTSLDIKNIKAAAGWTQVKVYLQNNNLSSITWPAGKKVSYLYVDGNKLNFATLAPLTECVAQARNFSYKNQQPMEVVANNGVVDLSSQAKVGETASEFMWTAGDNEFSSYTEANGVFTFTADATEAVCTIINNALPNLQLKTVAINIAKAGVEDITVDADGSAEYYTLQGVKVSGNEPGLYIRRQGNKVQKVLVK